MNTPNWAISILQNLAILSGHFSCFVSSPDPDSMLVCSKSRIILQESLLSPGGYPYIASWVWAAANTEQSATSRLIALLSTLLFDMGIFCQRSLLSAEVSEQFFGISIKETCSSLSNSCYFLCLQLLLVHAFYNRSARHPRKNGKSPLFHTMWTHFHCSDMFNLYLRLL